MIGHSQKKYPLPNSVISKSTFDKMHHFKLKMEIQGVQAKTDHLKGFEEKYAMGTIYDSLATDFNDVLEDVKQTILQNDLSDRSQMIERKIEEVDRTFQSFFSEYPTKDLNRKKVKRKIGAGGKSIKKSSRGGREGIPVPDFKPGKKEYSKVEEPASGSNSNQIGAESNSSTFSEEFLDLNFIKRYRVRLWEELLQR